MFHMKHLAPVFNRANCLPRSFLVAVTRNQCTVTVIPNPGGERAAPASHDPDRGPRLGNAAHPDAPRERRRQCEGGRAARRQDHADACAYRDDRERLRLPAARGGVAQRLSRRDDGVSGRAARRSGHSTAQALAFMSRPRGRAFSTIGGRWRRGVSFAALAVGPFSAMLDALPAARPAGLNVGR